jgi:chlorobactene glucosyltransferase
VIIPARNEASNIRTCVESILAMDYPSFEVIAADDHSTDATPEILESIQKADSRLKIVRVGDLAEGWTGKNFATQSAARCVSGRSEWLLLTDADTIHKPWSLASAMAGAKNRGLDFLSLFPQLVCVKPWEKLLIPSVGAMITLFNDPRKVNDPKLSDVVFANGQYMLVKKSVYDAAGGNESVKSCVLEDVEFARRLKKSGYKTLIAFGEEIFGTRMYSSIGEFMEGWSKNLFLIMGRSWLKTLGSVLISILFSWWPVISLFLGIHFLASGGNGVPVAAPVFLIALYPLTLFFQTFLRRISGSYPPYAILAPLGALVTSYLTLKSGWLITANKGVRWKGRTYGGRQ